MKSITRTPEGSAVLSLNEWSSWQGHGPCPAPVLVPGLCCPALQCSERLCHRSPGAAASRSPCSCFWHCRGSGSFRAQHTVLAENRLQPPWCSCSQNPGTCHECRCPVSRTASGSKAVGSGMSRPVMAARRDFSKHLTHSSNAQNWCLKAKKCPTNQISWKMPHAKRVSSSRGVSRCNATGVRENQGKERNQTKREQTNPNALILPSARAEPAPSTSLPSSSVCHLTEGRPPNLPFLLLPTWDGSTCPSQDIPTPLVLGEVQKPRTAQGK